MGGESIQAFAELPVGGQYHRSEPCACGPTGRSTAGDEPFAPARSYAPRLPSCRLAPVPPAGRSHHARRRPAKSRATGIVTAPAERCRGSAANHFKPGSLFPKVHQAFRSMRAEWLGWADDFMLLGDRARTCSTCSKTMRSTLIDGN